METQALYTLHRVLYETLKHLSGLTFIVRILPCSSSLLIIVKYVPRWPRLVIKEAVKCEGKLEVDKSHLEFQKTLKTWIHFAHRVRQKRRLSAQRAAVKAELQLSCAACDDSSDQLDSCVSRC